MIGRNAFRVALVLTFAVLFTPHAHAESLPAGTVELQPTFTYSHTSTGSDYGTTLDLLSSGLRVGHCVNEHLEVTGSLQFAYAAQKTKFISSIFMPNPGVYVYETSEYSSHQSQIGGTIGGEVHFPTAGTMLPYVGVEVGALMPSSGDVLAIAPQLRAGSRVFFGPRAALDFGLQWQRQSNGSGGSLSVLQFALGFSLFPGRR